MAVLDDVKSVVGDTLQLGVRVRAMGADTPLLGAVPELDSMAVVNVIMGLEERFGIRIEDDEIDASTFATFGTLGEFVERKVASLGVA